MNSIAVYSGETVLYWSAIIITLGIAAGFFLSYGIHLSHGGSAAAMWVFLPVSVIVSVFLCRLIHWYCHLEQYAGFFAAMTDFSVGSYCLPGMIFGVIIAAGLVKRLRLVKSRAELLDSAAPGMALTVMFIRLSALFDSSCRSKIIINNPALQHLPLASQISSASGSAEYRFATFFVEAIVMLVITILLLNFCFKRRDMPMKGGEPSEGHAARLLLVLYGAAELVLDSTRYDSSFFHFTFLKKLNPYAGFISLIQLIAAISILCVLVHYTKPSIRSNGLKLKHVLLWLVFLLSLAAVGVSEYMVQRHGDWYLGCYAAMTAGCVLMAFTVWRMYVSCSGKDEYDDFYEYEYGTK